MWLRRFKPNKAHLRVATLAILIVMCTLVILSTVFPFPEGTWRFLSIGTSQKAMANPDWLTGYDQRVEISIDADDVSANLTWFPVTLYLGTSVGINSSDVSFIFDEIGSNYKKIAVTSDDGTTQLYVEVEKWDASAEEAVLHISKTGWSISSSVDTDIYLYYDSSQADNDSYVNVAGAWDSNFQAVHHLSIGDNLLIYNGRSDTASYKIGAAFYQPDGTAVKYSGNPVFDVGAGGKFDDDHVKDPYVVKVSGTYYMFYAGYDGAKYAGIGVASSPDGITWTRLNGGNPIIALGAGGSWDDANVYAPIVYYDSGAASGYEWKMLYSGNDGTNIRIGYAHCATPAGTWTKEGMVLDLGTGGAWDDYHVLWGDVEKVGSTWYLYYEGRSAATGTRIGQVGLATCSAGSGEWESWSKSGSNPVFTPKTCGTTLTATLASGTKIATVASSTGFVVGEPVWIEDSTGGVGHREMNRVASIDSGTQITLVNNTERQYLSGDVFVSWMDSWITTRAVVYDSGTSTWKMWFTAFKVTGLATGAGILSESSGYATSSDGITWTVDYANSPTLGLADDDSGLFDETSAENCALIKPLLPAPYRGGLEDSTENSRDITPSGYPTTKVTGKVGYAVDTEGTDDKLVHPTIAIDHDDPFTISFWVNADAFSADVGFVINAADAHYNGALWVVPNANKKVRCGLISDWSGGNKIDVHGDTVLSVDTWYYITATYDGSDDASGVTIYVNGDAEEMTIDSNNLSATVDPSTDWVWGQTWNGYFNGTYDELRVASVERPAAWIKAAYESQRDNFVDWGGEETPTPEITNSPGSNDFGILEVSSTGQTTLDYFTITNTGNCAVDITIQGTDATGGDDTWTLADDGSPGENIYVLKAGLDGGDYTTIVKKTAAYNTLVSDLAEDATQDWGLKLWMPTSLSGYDNNEMTATITLVASEAS